MNAILTNRAWWRGAIRRWCTRFRRNACYTVLLVVLGFSLVEPLGCIAHCQSWLALGLHNTIGALHTHHLGTSQGTTLLSEQSADHSTSLHTAILARDVCSVHVQQRVPSDIPDPPASAPLHEHQAALSILVLLFFLVLVQYALNAPPRAPPRCAYPLPLRPPILVTPPR